MNTSSVRSLIYIPVLTAVIFMMSYLVDQHDITILKIWGPFLVMAIIWSFRSKTPIPQKRNRSGVMDFSRLELIYGLFILVPLLAFAAVIMHMANSNNDNDSSLIHLAAWWFLVTCYLIVLKWLQLQIGHDKRGEV